MASDQTGFTGFKKFKPRREKSGIRSIFFDTAHTYSLFFFHVARVERITATGKET